MIRVLFCGPMGWDGVLSALFWFGGSGTAFFSFAMFLCFFNCFLIIPVQAVLWLDSVGGMSNRGDNRV